MRGHAIGEREERLGALIRRLREERGLSQEELAALIGGGMTQSVVSRLERGVLGLPQWDRLVRIGGVLGVEPAYLMAKSGWSKADEVEGFEAGRMDGPEGAVPADPLVELTEQIWPKLAIADQAMLVRMARLMVKEHPRRR